MNRDVRATGIIGVLSEPAPGAFSRLAGWAPLLAAVLLGAVLRVYHLDAESFSRDEVYSLWLVQGNPLDLLRTIIVEKRDATPPAYYLVLQAFLVLGEDPFIARLPSATAGALMVWLTFRLAAELFDNRVAVVGAFLMAVAPFHIEYSQVARAYVLSALLSLGSLYFFARLVFGPTQRWDWVGLVAVTTAAVYTHYLTALLVIVFEDALVVLLWARRRHRWPHLKVWWIVQALLALLLSPLVYTALAHVGGDSGNGQAWIPRPGPVALAKTVILFGTGDPSFMGVRVTLGRALSLLLIFCLAGVGVWLLRRKWRYRASDGEAQRAIFLAGAFLIPWMATFAISQYRVIYLDKYLLFILPPLLILMGWVITRTWQIVWTRVLVLALVGLLARSLYLVYTEVHFEQWREAAMFVRAEYRSDEPIVIEPGFDFRPFAYYFNGNLPVNFHTIDTAPVLMDGDGVFSVLQPADGQRNQREDHATLVAAHRIWVVSSVDSASNVVESGESVAAVRLILDQFEPRESRVFAGPIRVRLFESGRALRR